MRIVLFIALLGVGSAACVEYADQPENTWVLLSPRAEKKVPKFGWEGCGVFDPLNRVWIHQGGHDGVPQGFALFTCDLSNGQWKQHFPNNSPAGVCCIDGSAAFDVANGKLVRFPGGSLGHGYQYSRGVRLKDSAVWLCDIGSDTWVNMRPPPYKEPAKYSKEKPGGLNASATYDPVHEVSLLMGGQGAGGGTNSLFVYDAYANNFEMLRPSNPPAARDGHGMVYDAKNDALVVFGSQYANDEKTWVFRYAANAWEGLDLNPHPPGHKNKQYSSIPKMAFDPLNGICLCVTWDDTNGSHQTWALDLASKSWTQMNPAKEADASSSRSRNLDYIPEYNLFVMELCAPEKSGRGPELWGYRYKKAPPPAPVTRLSLAADKGKAVLTWESLQDVKEYSIYRAQAEKPWLAKYEKLASVRLPFFEDDAAADGKLYFYRVKAVRDGKEGAFSNSVRTQPRTPLQPVVSVLAKNEIDVSWSVLPQKDIAGYNLYRGVASVRSVKKGKPAAWADNDPEYAEPQVVQVQDISHIEKLTTAPLTELHFLDKNVDLEKKPAESADYKYAVHAYILRAVNKLGVESGPSPYALTLPAEVQHPMLRENGQEAELKWDPSAEKVAGYHIYKMRSNWEFVRITDTPLKETKFTHQAGGHETRYWIVPVDILGQEGQPSSPLWCNHKYAGFFKGDWHQ